VSRRKPPLTELGKALRERDACLRSDFEDDYDAAIKAALGGNTARLVDLLWARRPPTDADFDRLADYVTKRPRGRERNEAVHEAVQIAETIMTAFGRSERVRTRAIEIGCKQVERERGALADHDLHEQVRDLLRRPKKRRRLK
jgi:hypothetical protein